MSLVRQKFRASGIHFSFSLLAAAIVLCFVFLGWYPQGLSTLMGVGSILFIMIFVDMVIGPLVTAIIYRPKKKSLKFDLTIIGGVQLAFLFYGIYAVELGRPAYIVFVKDRFETASPADWSPEVKANLLRRPNSNADRYWYRPKYIGTTPPKDEKRRFELMMSMVKGGADFAQLPEFYSDISNSLPQIVAKAKGIDELKSLNVGREIEIDAFIANTGKASSELGFIPLKAKLGDGVVLVDRLSGNPISIGLFKPWN